MAPINAQQLVDRIERSQWVTEGVVRALRRHLADASSPVSLNTLTVWLIQQGHLTESQVTRLLSEGERPGSQAEATRRSAPAKSALPPQNRDTVLGDDLDLDLDVDWDGKPPSKEPRLAAPNPKIAPLPKLQVPEWSDVPPDPTRLPADGTRLPLTMSARLWRGGRKTWDSPLILLGSGGLLVLVFLGTFLFFYLQRGSADEVLQQAEEEYRRGAYNQATFFYQDFLKRFAGHPKSSLARVRMGTARLWDVVENHKDWEQALRVAHEVMPQLSEEEAVGEARSAYASILVSMYEGFIGLAEAAMSSQDRALDQLQQLVERAHEVRKLIDNSEYLPTSVRQPIQARIEGAENRLNLVIRDMDRDHQLQLAIQKMQAATAGGDTQQAFRERDQFLQRYPAVANAPALRKAIQENVERERQSVRAISVPWTPINTERPAEVTHRVALSLPRRPGVAAQLEGHVVCLLIRGVVYGINGQTGAILWRRGVGVPTQIQPQPLGAHPGADVLIVDGHHHALIRADAAKGVPRWLLPIGEPFLRPIILKETLIVATKSGKLLRLDAGSGAVRAACQLPQTLTVPPSVDSRHSRLLQLAEHTTLFVLSTETLECVHAYGLGHGMGRVATSPVVLPDHVMIAENAGMDFAWLHVLSLEGPNAPFASSGDPLRIEGRVDEEPLVFGRRAVVFTDRGAVRVLEFPRAEEREMPRVFASRPAADTSPHAVHAWVQQDQLWLADTQLSRFEIHAARGELVQRWIQNAGDRYSIPMRPLSDVLVAVRERQGMPGVTVSAIPMAIEERNGSRPDQAPEPLWEVDLAVPLAGDVKWDGRRKKIAVVTCQGALFDIDAAALQAGVLNEPAQTLDAPVEKLYFDREVVLSPGNSVYLPAQGSTKWMEYHSQRADDRLKLRPLAIVAGAFRTAVAFGSDVLVPTLAGPIYQINPTTGQPTRLPYRPDTTPDSQWAWQVPLLVPGSPDAFVIGDASGKLIRVVAKTEPRPQWSLQAETQLDGQVVASAAAIERTGCVVLRRTDHDAVQSFQLDTFVMGQPMDLEGRAVWGLTAAGGMVLVATDRDHLYAFQPTGELAWKVPLEYGRPVGQPLVAGSELLLTSVEGRVWRVRMSDGQRVPWNPTDGPSEVGEVQAALDVGEPLARGAVLVGRFLVLVGHDGSLHVAEFPVVAAQPEGAPPENAARAATDSDR